MSQKIELQIKALQNNVECKMCSTDGLIGRGCFDEKENYKKYNAEYYFNYLYKKYKQHDIDLKNGFPKIWNLNFIKIHNCIITSSVVVEKETIKKAGCMPFDRRGQDYQCWLKVLQLTNNFYLKDICFYYDSKHGNGANH